MVQLLRHRQTKGSATDRLHLHHRVTPRLHLVDFGTGNLVDIQPWACGLSAEEMLPEMTEELQDTLDELLGTS